MNKLLLILFILPFFWSCQYDNKKEDNYILDSTNQLNDIVDKESANYSKDWMETPDYILDFPKWSDTIQYISCSSKQIKDMKRSVFFNIYNDTLINLNYWYDKDIAFKFYWDEEYMEKGEADGYYEGIRLVEVIKNNKVIGSMDIKSKVHLEAFSDKNFPNDRLVKQVFLEDANYDGYLDFVMDVNSGRPGYWLFNPNTEQFTYDNSVSNILRLIAIDCEKKIVYSYNSDGTYGMTYTAYKINNGKVEEYQSVYRSCWQKEFCYKVYYNSLNDTLFLDTIQN